MCDCHGAKEEMDLYCSKVIKGINPLLFLPLKVIDCQRSGVLALRRRREKYLAFLLWFNGFSSEKYVNKYMQYVLSLYS